MMTLQQMLDAAEAQARRVLIGTDDELTPIFHLADAEGNGVLMATPFVGRTPEEVDALKDMVAAAVRSKIKEHKAVAYCFLSEAWMVTRKQYTPGVSQRPAEFDDRIEVVIAIAHGADEHVTRRWKIKREGAKCVDLIPQSEEGERWSGKGRFENLLEEAAR